MSGKSPIEQAEALESAKAIGERLKMHPQTVRRMALRGELPFVRVSRSMRFSWPNVRAALGQSGTAASDADGLPRTVAKRR